MNTCIMCEKEYKDTHSGRNTPKEKQTCCRACYLARLKRDGQWNTGLKWEDMYNKKTLEIMKKRVNTTGKDHFNSGKDNIKLLFRNLIDNPNKTLTEKKFILDMFEKHPNKTILDLLLKMKRRKKVLYQEKAFKKYGRKCVVCGKIDGQMDIHHKDGNHENNHLNNLVVLCAPHHAILHKRNRTIEQLKRQFR